VLVYGPDAGRVHEVAAGIVRSAAGSTTIRSSS
jgi:hypothetical protein